MARGPLLEVEPASVLALANRALHDLDAERLGLPWMGAPTAIRILLSDHLVNALATTLTDLREVAYSLEDFRDAVRAIETRSRRRLRKTNGESAVAQETPTAERERIRRDTAITSFFRAGGSVMDNLSIAMVIIGGYHLEVVERLTWPTGLSLIEKECQRTSASLDQRWLYAQIAEAVKEAGPTGWLAWTLDMRNMLVHRPRRMWMTHLKVRRDGRGRIVGAAHNLLLPLEPALVDVEVMRQQELTAAVLMEPAQVTMSGVLESLLQVAESIAKFLMLKYDVLASASESSDQPVVQWRKGIIPKRQSSAFLGYDPSVNEMEDITGLETGEDMMVRMRAAAVQDSRRINWPQWLAEATPPVTTQPNSTNRADGKVTARQRRRQQAAAETRDGLIG